jgi:hypothetical protein
MSEEEFVTMKKDNVSIKEVIIAHIRKISDLTCQELTPSFWSKKPMKVGDGVAIVETYHPDLRMAYITAVDFLQDLLMPKADEQFNKSLNVLNEEEENLFNEHKSSNRSQDDWIWTKLGLRRVLFGQLILLINRVKLFEPSIYVEGGEEGWEDELEGDLLDEDAEELEKDVLSGKPLEETK